MNQWIGQEVKSEKLNEGRQDKERKNSRKRKKGDKQRKKSIVYMTIEVCVRVCYVKFEMKPLLTYLMEKVSK